MNATTAGSAVAQPAQPVGGDSQTRHQQTSSSQPADQQTPTDLPLAEGIKFRNPVFGEAQRPSPDKSREYAPKYAEVMRQPSGLAMTTDASLPMLGDLYAAQPELPAGISFTATDDASGSLPQMPGWNSSRPYLTGQFILEIAEQRIGSRESAEVLESYPTSVQETILVDDMLSAFMGLSGTYIRAMKVNAVGGVRLTYEIITKGQLEPALQEMAARMLPLCEYVAVIQRFVETRREYGWGLVCQALAGAMRNVLQDWELMVAQLEHQLRTGKLTLQALWYYVQPPMLALRQVASLAAEASAGKLRGATLLDLLHYKCAAIMGDAQGHKLALRLLRAATEPYFAMLERWLGEGILDDPYKEFMVQEDKSITKTALTSDGQAAFWHARYVLRQALDGRTGVPATEHGGEPLHEVPVFLQRMKEAVLSTGKYLNLMRESGQCPARTLPLGAHLEYDEGGKYLLQIEEAHRAASFAAMDMLRRDLGLVSGLSVLKRYFLTAQGDTLLHFMDAADAELRMPVAQVPLLQMQSLLGMAVRSSSAAEDPAATNMKAAFDYRTILSMLMTIVNQGGSDMTPMKTPLAKLKPTTPAPMTASDRTNVGRRPCRECIILSYDVPWPLSVVAPESTIAQYQMVFRHLFELKWVERELNRVCSLYQQTRGLHNSHKRLKKAGSGEYEWLAQSYRLCMVMTHFFRQYLMYVTFEVLEPLWRALQAKVQTAQSLDEIIEHHRVFLNKVMKGTLLKRKVQLLRTLLDLKAQALKFVEVSAQLQIDHEAMEEEVAEAFAGVGKGAGERVRRQAKVSRVRSALDAVLKSPEFTQPVSDLHRKFQSSLAEFTSQLAMVHRQAQSDKTDTREELESLVNLIARLDFNGYISARSAAASQGAGGAAPPAGADRYTVKFTAAS